MGTHNKPVNMKVVIVGDVYLSKHMRNGWKNPGLPWGYNFHPDLMWETD